MPGAWGRRSVGARRQFWVGLVVVGVLAGCGATDSQEVTADTLSPDAQVAIDCGAVISAYLDGLHGVVHLRAGASDHQIGEVRAVIDELPVVRSEFVDAEQALAELRAQYPDEAVLDAVTVDDVPASFRLELAAPIDLHERLLGTDGVINAYSQAPPPQCQSHPLVRLAAERQIAASWRSTDLRIFLQPDHSGTELRTLLRRDDRVVDGWFVDGDAAVAQFRCMFADSPDLYESVTADILPQTIELDLADGATVEGLVAELNEREEVREVVERPNADTLFVVADPTPSDLSRRSGCPPETEPL